MKNLFFAALAAALLSSSSANTMQLPATSVLPTEPVAGYTPWWDDEPKECGACTPMEEGWEFYELVPEQEVAYDVPPEEVELHAIGYDPEITTDENMSSAEAEGYCLELTMFCGPQWADQSKDSEELEMLWVELELRAMKKRAKINTQAVAIDMPN